MFRCNCCNKNYNNIKAHCDHNRNIHGIRKEKINMH